MKTFFSTKVVGGDFIALILRIASGVPMLLFHGWKKLAGFAEKAADFADPLGVGSSVSLGLTVFAEVLCALCIIFGFLSRLAAIPYVITMFVATFMIHAGDPFEDRELAMVYLLLGLGVLIAGSGKYSLDKAFLNK
jgi:putative oxidoreductase